ncbi:replication factor C subunit [Babesia ovis]|uniref:Replication factor C subunit n=1 Tax=Babesia ovis TaxID=5869 RepID=A0A9W5T8Z7_BABOV|nr:replication factor C subunit [Babesia ovis]
MKGNVPWVEKYRPAKLDDIVFQTHAVTTMRHIVDSYDMPHMIFHGPPGTGKTSAALAIARQIYGPEGMKERVLELNASDERGINVVRERIKTYTRLNISSNRINPQTGRAMPNFKMIILDEADMITPDAQAALRRIIENFSNISRFILICNYLHKIIGPIYSRCSAFHFKPISMEAQVERLRFICQSEQLECEDSALEFLTRVSQGDMRRSVTILQSTASLFNNVTEEAVRNVSGYPPRRIVDEIFTACLGSTNDVETLCKQIIYDGWEIATIFQQLSEYVVNSDTLTDVQKATITIELSGRDLALLQGSRPTIFPAGISLLPYSIHPCQRRAASVRVTPFGCGVTMTSINVKLLVNRFDSDPSIRGAELEVSDTISIIKERYFAEDIEKQFNIRIIHGGCTLRDDLVLSGLRGYKVGEQLVLTVFVTKPDTLPTVPEPGL